jgi:hypothetical protein
VHEIVADGGDPTLPAPSGGLPQASRRARLADLGGGHVPQGPAEVDEDALVAGGERPAVDAPAALQSPAAAREPAPLAGGQLLLGRERSITFSR